jgi:tRNA 2-thiouridine synthesizing protein A
LAWHTDFEIQTIIGHVMVDELDSQDEIDLSILVSDLKRMRADCCIDCGAAICGHEALMSLTMGFKNAPRCWHCLSSTLEHDRDALRDRLFALIAHRSCYHAGWMWANQAEGFDSEALPGCLWPTHSLDTTGKQQSLSPEADNKTLLSDSGASFDVEWDAGDMGCGDLVLELRTRLQSVNPGQILRVLATDSGAEEDLPAWCRMTGNTLVTANHPVYLIKRKAAG